MFKQGMFLIDPNATPEQIKAQREALARMQYGRASNVGEGVGDLMQGFAAGIQKRGLNRTESSGRESAMAGFKEFLSGGFGGENVEASPTVEQPTVDPVVTGSTQKTSPDVGGLESYIRDSAAKRGIDPDVAVRVARSEGLAPGVWQSNVVKGGKRETSYGPFQLLVGGGLGDKFQELYGKSPADPSTVHQQIDFALDEAAQGGWGPWYGAAKVGVGKRTGLDSARALGYQQTAPAPQGAAQAVNAMGSNPAQPAPQQTGGILGTMLAGGFKQQPGGAGSAMDVWQGRAGQGTANDGSQLVRTPEGVRRTSTKGYSEIIRPEGMPSERAPMPRGQGGGIGSFIANALSGGGQQQAPQMQQPAPITDPAAYNEQVVRMSPDLAGPMRADVPQGQPPIPGIQPTAPTISDMAGRMPAPQDQQIAQGMEGLRNAMQPQQALPAQAAPAPQQLPVQAAPAPQRLPQQQPQGVDQEWLMQAMTLANNPFLPAAERATLQAIIEQKMQAADPMRQLEMDYKRAQLDQLRNPRVEPTESMRNLKWRAEQAGLVEGTPEYSDFMRSGGAKDGVTVNVGDGSNEYNKALDKKFAEQYIGMQDGAQAARGKLATLQGLGAALSQASRTGFGAETMLDVKKAASALGVDTGDLGPEETARALGNQLALQLRNPSGGAGMPGAMSDKDREFLVASVPGLSKESSGNAKLIELMTRVEQRNIDVARLAQEYADRTGQIDNGFYKELSAWSEQNPLFDQQAQQAAQKPISEMTDEELEALVNGE